MNKRAKGARRPLTCLSAALLALVSSSAMALGLGDIRVLSKPGQPLLAEIPVISADPSELENLRVALASPVTFERVGLQRPAGLVSELQFELTRNAQGRAVVRVTSQTPVETPSLSFLIEADWGQGRLVREYSALVDAPASALAVAEPEIVAPAGVLSDTIVRDAPAAAATTAEPAPVEAAAAPAAPRPRAAAPAPAPALAADDSVTVQRGQTLSQIAGSLARGNQISRDRAMIALLRANPEAFIRGNVNLLKQGAVLRMPGDTALAAVDAAEAAALVREHAAQWRQARTVPQPAGAPMPVAKADGTVSSPAAATGARLEIAPALASDAAHAGTTTGTTAGSEGDMLGNEQLRQAKEDIATRDAEIGDLKQRVAELEKLKEQQQSLIAMKDNDLAAAQQRLAQAPGAPGAGTPWYWLGLPLLVLVALGAWLLRRRKPSPLPPLREEHDAAGLAAALPAGAALDTLAEQDAGVSFAAEGGRQEPAMPAWASTAGHDAPDAEIREDASPAEWRAGELDEDALAELPAAVNDLPRWDDAAAPVTPIEAADVAVPEYALQAEQEPQFRGVFDLPAEPHEHETAALVGLHDDHDHDADEDVVGSPAGNGHDWTPRVGQERLELAIAYLDLGDAQTARTLLHEVAEGGDLHCQAQARELLARLP
ncbi:FimV/HubP family polar landmark protein [Stenotrophomonas sp. G106K1]|uniref:FimV/HubP family polar landmark protein n=1 Tax=Stenotrophomonas sp. G106K1 TaxID=3134792 RepID=UPI0030F4463D